MNHKKTITLPHIFKTLLPKQLYKQRFLLQDKGHSSYIEIANDVRIIGNSTITIRKGDNNRITIGSHGKLNKLKIDINGNHNQVTIAEHVKFSGQLLGRVEHWRQINGKKNSERLIFKLSHKKDIVRYASHHAQR